MGLEIKGLANLASLVPGFAQGHAQSVEQRQRQQQIDQQGMAFEQRARALDLDNRLMDLKLRVAEREMGSQDAFSEAMSLRAPGASALGAGQYGPPAPRASQAVSPSLVSGLPILPGRDYQDPGMDERELALLGRMSPEDQQRYIAAVIEPARAQARMQAETQRMESVFARIQQGVAQGTLPPQMEEMLPLFAQDFQVAQISGDPKMMADSYESVMRAVDAGMQDMRRLNARAGSEASLQAIMANPNIDPEVKSEAMAAIRASYGGGLDLEEEEFTASFLSALAGDGGRATAQLARQKRELEEREAMRRRAAMQQGGGGAGARRPLQALQPPEVGGIKQALEAAEGPEDIAAIEQRYNVELTMQDIEALIASQAQESQGGGGLSPFSDKPERLSKKPKGSSQAIPVPQDAAGKRRFLEELERSGGALAPPVDPMEQYRHLLPQ